MTIGTIISEPLVIHKIGGSKKERKDRVKQLLDLVGLRSELALRCERALIRLASFRCPRPVKRPISSPIV